MKVNRDYFEKVTASNNAWSKIFHSVVSLDDCVRVNGEKLGNKKHRKIEKHIRKIKEVLGL